MRVIHELTVEVRFGSTRMDILIESMTTLEYAMTRMVDGKDIRDEMYETLYSIEKDISPYQKSWVMP